MCNICQQKKCTQYVPIKNAKNTDGFGRLCIIGEDLKFLIGGNVKLLAEILLGALCKIRGHLTVLLTAIEENNLQAVIYILSRKPELITVRLYGYKNILMYALEKCKEDEVPLFLTGLLSGKPYQINNAGFICDFPYLTNGGIPAFDRDGNALTAYDYAICYKRNSEIIKKIIENSRAPLSYEGFLEPIKFPKQDKS